MKVLGFEVQTEGLGFSLGFRLGFRVSELVISRQGPAIPGSKAHFNGAQAPTSCNDSSGCVWLHASTQPN